VADKRCENGHFIDESWDICPYCPQDESEPEIPVVRPRAVEPPRAKEPAADGHAVVAAAPALRPVTSHAPRAAGPGGTSPSLLAVPAAPAERTVAASRQDLAAGGKRYVVGWLVGLSGSDRGESYAVRLGRNVIGRDRRSDIVVNDDQASSHHADLVFRPDEKRFILMDHNSTNGTYVNEAEIEPRRDLAEKDVIRIGSHRFLFTPLCHDGFHWDDEGLLK
jgi:hypothetical protein